MRKIFILICMALFASGVVKAQVGLENVTIETYYVANAADIAYNVPGTVEPLPAGAKTYRVYVDMAPGWELQAIFGATNVGTGEVDTLVFRSTSPFWNHTDRGDLYGYNIPLNQVDDNTVALDSWFSTGRSTATTSGVLEVVPTEDVNGQTPTFPHTPATLLINNDPLAGLPLTTEDGNITVASSIVWTPTPGLEAILDPIFGSSNSAATAAVVQDGALGVTVSLQGPNAANRVCIGQFTTGGLFSGKINLQIRNTTTLVVETYVAETPQSGQFTAPYLTWGPNTPPTVAITNPTDGQNFAAGATVNIAATASDADGSVTQVQIFKDGVVIATIPAPGPYTTSFVAGLVTTTHELVARATDDDGAMTSDTIHITVTGNNPPVVMLTAPPTAITGTTVNISATATDPDGITQIEFFFNGSSIGIDNTPPYQASFTATPAGVKVIQAVATDGFGATGQASQNITITNNVAPTVSITSPANGSFVPQGPVMISANANDTDGSVSQVEFFVNGLSIGVDNTGPAPFTMTWNAVFVGPFGANSITAIATDNLGLAGNSAPINVNVIDPAGSPYAVGSVTQVCNPETVCIPVKAISAIQDVIGFDMVLTWDDTKIYPTGNVTKTNAFMNPNFYETDNSIDFVNHQMLVSVFLDTDAPVGTDFTGTGDIICIEFAKRPGFHPVDSATVTVTNMQESYFNGVLLKNPVIPGEFKTFKNTIMTSNLEFWADAVPIGFDGANVSPTIQDNIAFDCSLASAASPLSLAGPVVQPDINGVFTYDLNNGLKFSINKQIADATDVQEVINGFDALLTRRFIIDDASFTPSVQQAIAMDVNRDGAISAGDVSQINQRAVLLIDEFKQEWNYNADGSQKPTYSDSKDWEFIDNSTVALNPNYQISSAFPNDNGVGYSKYRVPKVPFCLNAPVTNFLNCPTFHDESYTGILLGDINGNWANTSNVLLRTNESVNVEVGKAQYGDTYVDVPVTFTSNEDIYSVDLNLDFDDSKLAYNTLVAGDIQAVGFYNENDRKLRITSNSLKNLNEGEVVLMIRFTRLSNDDIKVGDFNAAIGYLNGENVNVNLTNGSHAVNDVFFNVYPNPTNDYINIGIDKDVKAEIIDMNGQVWISDITVNANSRQRVDVSGLPGGIYMVRVSGDDYTSTKRVFVGK